MALLDEVQAEVNQLTDEQIAEAAQKLIARQQAQRAAITPERAAKAKEREKRRRMLNSEIVKLAKAKGLVPAAVAPESTPTA